MVQSLKTIIISGRGGRLAGRTLTAVALLAGSQTVAEIDSSSPGARQQLAGSQTAAGTDSTSPGADSDRSRQQLTGSRTAAGDDSSSPGARQRQEDRKSVV